MFGIGLSELVVILCVAIVFIRPKDLPRLLRRLGRLYARAKAAYDQIIAARDDLVNDIGKESGAEEDTE